MIEDYQLGWTLRKLALLARMPKSISMRTASPFPTISSELLLFARRYKSGLSIWVYLDVFAV
jgi:hypothetical protein